MTRINHMIINWTVFLSNPWAILGGFAPDLFFIPIDIYDSCRKYKKFPHRELSNLLVHMNWWCHSFWFLIMLGIFCKRFEIPNLFFQGYALHIILDVLTHTRDRALKIFYPISNSRFDIIKTGIIKGL